MDKSVKKVLTDSKKGLYYNYKVINERIMNDEAAQKLLKTAYDQIRVVKLVQRGLRSPTLLAKKMGWTTRQKANYYIQLLTK